MKVECVRGRAPWSCRVVLVDTVFIENVFVQEWEVTFAFARAFYLIVYAPTGIARLNFTPECIEFGRFAAIVSSSNFRNIPSNLILKNIKLDKRIK